MGIDVSAAYFAEITHSAGLTKLFEQNIIQKKPILVIGSGSNILFTENFNGLVIKPAIEGITYKQKGNTIELTAGAGVIWNELVEFSVNKGFCGLENLTLIPGTVGASPVQNIGAYGVELKDVFHSCKAFEIATGKTKTFDLEACRFGYRESVFKNELKGQYIITAVTFNLSKKVFIQPHYLAISNQLELRGITRPTIKDIAEAVAAIRTSKLPNPSIVGNAGSFFKNPVIEVKEFEKLRQVYPEMVYYPTTDGKVKLAAGWLIEKSGFKGAVYGQTGTWKNQALVLVNYGKATGKEVYDFSEKIIKSVREKFGLTLKREVNVL